MPASSSSARLDFCAEKSNVKKTFSGDATGVVDAAGVVDAWASLASSALQVQPMTDSDKTLIEYRNAQNAANLVAPSVPAVDDAVALDAACSLSDSPASGLPRNNARSDILRCAPTKQEQTKFQRTNTRADREQNVCAPHRSPSRCRSLAFRRRSSSTLCRPNWRASTKSPSACARVAMSVCGAKIARQTYLERGAKRPLAQ